MLDRQGILSQYRPFHPYSVEVMDTHPDYGEELLTLLNEYDFSFQPQAEDDDDSNTPQVYWGDEPLTFVTERGNNKIIAKMAQDKLAGQPLRLPLINRCWGRNQSWMFSNSLVESLSFSPILGITRTPATIVDAVGQHRQGYTALTFHKFLTADRIESRLANVPVEQRLIVPVSMKEKTDGILLIHESLMQQWQQQGVTDIEYEISDEHLSLAELEENDMYYQSAGSMNFYTMDDYQNNRNGKKWEM